MRNFKKPKTFDEFLTNAMSRYILLDNGCWLWDGCRIGGKYGRATFNYTHYATHRLFYQRYKGEIPIGYFVCHKCDNTGCVNPEHLFLGTPKENTMDMIRKGRRIKPWAGKTHCAKGHEYTPENTIPRSKTGTRLCRSCRDKNNREYRIKNRDKLITYGREYRRKN